MLCITWMLLSQGWTISRGMVSDDVEPANGSWEAKCNLAGKAVEDALLVGISSWTRESQARVRCCHTKIAKQVSLTKWRMAMILFCSMARERLHGFFI
ncbi:hypothetical protein DL98DRAFT_12845 [Cadophora sp. DSE1049]|nr:hypothetical protein DL98DRAFT_12845 [Cadophora sp. DSE1049]